MHPVIGGEESGACSLFSLSHSKARSKRFSKILPSTPVP